jgi:hypothetical protein
MMTSDHRVRKRIFTNQPQKTSIWSHLFSFFSSVAAVVFGAIIAMLLAEHLESGSTVGSALSSWLNWFTSQVAGVDPFITVAIVAVLGLVGLAFYARDH